jgi:hypothetical protein
MLLSKCGLAHAKALEMGIFPTRILLAIDGSEEAELASRKAVDLANEIDSELYVVHVGLLPNFLMGDLGTVGYDSILYEQIERESSELFRKLVWQVKFSGGTVAGAYLRHFLHKRLRFSHAASFWKIVYFIETSVRGLVRLLRNGMV